MKYLIDLHVHTIASAHAYSTIEEISQKAALKGIEAFAITDHGPSAPDGPHRYFFSNLKVIPEFINGIKIIKGVEANIIDADGNLDLEPFDLDKLEIVLAGFHKLTGYGESEYSRNTNALVNSIKKGYVDVISHPGNPEYPFDYKKVLVTAKEYNVAIEVNNSSFTVSRKGSESNCKKILIIAKEIGNFISIGSDAHISFDVGNIESAESLLEEIEYDENLIINRDIEILYKFLKQRKNVRKNK